MTTPSVYPKETHLDLMGTKYEYKPIDTLSVNSMQRRITCSSPPLSPTLFKWFRKNAWGSLDESLANNNQARIGTSFPQFISSYNRIAWYSMRSLTASNSRNSLFPDSSLKSDNKWSVFACLELDFFAFVYLGLKIQHNVTTGFPGQWWW